MKKFFIIAVMAVAALTAKAQTPEVGSCQITPYVGIINQMYSKTIESGSQKAETKTKVGLTVGAEFGYQVAKWFRPSIALQYMGARFKATNTAESSDANFSTDYLAVPVLANFYVCNGLALKIGVEPAFLLSAKNEGHDVKDAMKSADFLIPFGISYEFSNFVVDARMHISTSKLFKKDTETNELFKDFSNQFVSLTVGYRIGL